MRKFLCFFACIICFIATAQEKVYQALLLNKNLLENADAVVRLDETKITLHSIKKMTVSKHQVITVLRKAGNGTLTNYVHYDPLIKLKSYEAIVYGAFGQEIEKIKKKDFKDVSVVSGFSLYEDSRVKYFEYTPISYPYTIGFNYSYETPNTAFIPQWIPIDDFRVSVEKSEYHLSNPSGIKVRELRKNFEGYEIENRSTGKTIVYTVSNVKAIKEEALAPAFGQLKPRLLLGLDKFHLEGVDGSGNDWASLGKWQYDNLLVNKDKLSDATIAKVKNMLSGIEDPLEKAKMIYKYVQNNTRYISVQLGIGGWMPISAEEVDRVKYGDCKGLTNYTKALLKSQGIESYYSVVYAGKGKRSLEKDFASMQGNHVILNLPNGDDDIWLECTNQTIPFGFLGDFTDDRDVLVITPKGGLIKHTPIYADNDNKKVIKAKVILTAEGNVSADVTIVSKGIVYNNRSALERMTKNKKDKHYKDYWGNINGLKVSEMQSSNDMAAVEYTERVKLEASSYAGKAGNDMLFKVNLFNAKGVVPSRYRNRKQAFEISRGYENEDSYTITLPDNYQLSQLPEPIAIENKFGSYSVNISKNENNQLQYERKLLIKKGSYVKDEYVAYRNFRKKVAQNDNLKVILTK